jgi:uncharacterized RDD family membrane protein YckC
MADMNYGGFWIRVVATIIDGIVISIPLLLLQMGLVWLTGLASVMYLLQLGALVLIIYLEGVKGGTPGKLILGLRVVNEQGAYIGMGGALLRQIGKIVSMITLGIGFLMVAFTEKKQGLHDKIASTYVVKADSLPKTN